MSLAWKKLRQEERRVGFKWVTAKLFMQPSGRKEEYITWGRAGGAAVAVIALTEDDRVVVARQYRPGPEAIFDELPGGGVESGEDLAAAAVRELAEETGFTSNEAPQYLGVVCRDAYANDVNHYFLLQNCHKTVEQELDDTEFIEVDTITIAQLIDNAKRTKMSDVGGVLLAYDLLKGGIVDD